MIEPIHIIDVELFNTHSQTDHVGRAQLHLYEHYGIRLIDIESESLNDPNDELSGWKHVKTYSKEVFNKAMIAGIQLSRTNRVEENYWNLYIDVNGVAESYHYIFESRKKAEPVFQILLQWWMGK